MAVNWALGLQQGPGPADLFQQGLQLGQQRRRENFLMEAHRTQMERQQRTQEAQQRAGKRIAAGDLPGARTEAAQSGDLDLVSAINRMTADQRAEAAAQAQTLAPVYNRLRQIPYEQRRAELQRIAPQLQARGIPADVVSTYDPTDGNLDSDISLAQTLEQQMEQQRTHWQIIPQVGAFAVDNMGRPVTPGQPGAGQPQAQPQMQAPVAAQPAQPGAQPTATGYAASVGTALAQAGVPAPVVAGILANGHHESGGQWNAAAPGDDGTAHGAFQWRNERAANFQRITGTDPRSATPEQTAQFVMWELQNPEQAGMTRDQVQAIMNAQTPEEAARLFSRYYERPNAALAHDDRRVALAAQYAGQQTAQAGPVPTPGQPRSIQEQAASGVIQAPRQAPPGFEWTPQGQLHAIAGGPGDRTYDRSRDAVTDARAGRQEVNQTLENFTDDPEVRQFRQARIAAMQLRTLGQGGSATDDIAMIFSFMRSLDPNSTVREGEFATAQNAAGIPDRIRNLYNQMVSGTRLSPQQRQQMVSTGTNLYIDRARSYNEIANNYRERLRTMGAPADQIARLVPTAEGPQRQDRRRAEEGQQRAPQGAAEAARRAVDTMIPGQRQQPRRNGRTSSGVRWHRVD